MDIWFIIKERFTVLLIFFVFIIMSLLLLIATLKNRAHIPKALLAIIIPICTAFIILSIIAAIFVISFGYNA